MKRKLVIITVLSFIFTLSSMAQDVTDILGVKTLNFNGTNYELGWSTHNGTQFMQEYFPKGQNPTAYKEMFTIYIILSSDISPETAVFAKEKELSARKGKDVYDWMISNSPDEKEWMIDFICYQGDQDKPSIVEFDAHRYRTIKINGKKALQLMFYTRRSYGNDVMPFMKDELSDLRIKALNALIEFDVKCKIKK